MHRRRRSLDVEERRVERIQPVSHVSPFTLSGHEPRAHRDTGKTDFGCTERP
jgi:hypothetical protein